MDGLMFNVRLKLNFSSLSVRRSRERYSLNIGFDCAQPDIKDVLPLL